ncbi:positive regulator of sigma E, RseC/MucC [Alkaliphilus metalliredigens QYMF]|uniref:Positive regulator of sigma E, RseC/MucC n=1 Tax=Alkaliphilus metalliredigens (strain QYMF) TaxID=293826 RepID=A6TT71_ALKMQ|nr:SoxR reducing system RseC family protein [Alkaliphilus metalliredigens]ABR49389.1 positive regulator of sigma E, RseC/MucC [Alkaliphilus metalliredigens QYMF]
MEKIGVVKEVGEGIATIEIQRVSACGESCASCKGGCTPTATYVKATNEVGAQVGQYVKLNMENKKVLKAAFLVYMVPLIGMIFGIGLGIWIGELLSYEGMEELIGIGVGFIFLILAYFGINRIDKRIRDKNEMRIEITSVIY